MNSIGPLFIARRTRGWITLAFAFVGLAIPLALRSLGLTNYDPTVPPDYAPRVGDVSAVERLCVVFSWMIYACLLVGAAALALPDKTDDFGTASSRVLPLLSGTAGVALLVYCWARWSAQPYSGKPFGQFEGWPFSVAWLLFWATFAFWPTRPK